MPPLTIRLATEADLPAIECVMERAIAELQKPFLDPAQIAASRRSMGLDTTLVADETYFCVMDGEALAGCGGCSSEPRVEDSEPESIRQERRMKHEKMAPKGARPTDPVADRR